MKKLPKTEFEIMKFIWGKNEKLPTKEIGAYMELLLGWKLSTTSKTLSRLVDKGFITNFTYRYKLESGTLELQR